jgi:hypothetical protein
MAPLLSKQFSEHPISTEKLVSMVTDLRNSLASLHKTVADATAAKRAKARSLPRGKKPHKSANFSEGDFVLLARVQDKLGNKLRAKWTGPHVVTKCLSDWVYEIEHLTTKARVIAHAQRLRFYSDSSLEVTEELLEYVTNSHDVYQVDHLVDIRPSKDGYEILVQWLGFSEHERSWEPIQQVYEDVPVALKTFLTDVRMESIWDSLNTVSMN